MLLLRFLLVFVFIFYFLRLFGRYFSGKGKAEPGKGSGIKPGGTEMFSEDYRQITDQKIEDADYEEL